MDENRKRKQEEYSDKMMQYYAQTNDNDFQDKMESLRNKLVDASYNFIVTFDGAIVTHRKGLVGKLVVLVKRAIRKCTHFLLQPYAEKSYQFQTKSLETIGGIIDLLGGMGEEYGHEKMSSYLENVAVQMKDVRESASKQISAITEQNEARWIEIQALHTRKIEELQDAQNNYLNEKESVLHLNNEVQLKMNHLNFVEERVNTHYQQVLDSINLQMRELNYIKASIVDLNQDIKNNINKIDTDNGKINICTQIENTIDFSVSLEGRNTGFMSYAQCGEDGILHYIFHVKYRMDPSNIRYIDIGCNDYKKDSNTFYFYKTGANGVLVDANPVCIELARQSRPRDIALNVGIGAQDASNMTFYILNNYGLSSFSKEAVYDAINKNPELSIDSELSVPVMGINTLLSQYYPDGQIDLLSIDAEGIDIDILTAIDYNQFRPKTIIVEAIDYDPGLVVGQKRTDIISIMKQKGYQEFAFTGINSVFIDPNLFND